MYNNTRRFITRCQRTCNSCVLLSTLLASAGSLYMLCHESWKHQHEWYPASFVHIGRVFFKQYLFFLLKVQPHLKKCFDNIKTLKMAKVWSLFLTVFVFQIVVDLELWLHFIERKITNTCIQNKLAIIASGLFDIWSTTCVESFSLAVVVDSNYKFSLASYWEQFRTTFIIFPVLIQASDC
jgi:hypothetical protein